MAQYTYGYKTEDPGQATYSEQNEQRNGNAVTGFYSTLLPDGRVQVSMEYGTFMETRKPLEIRRRQVDLVR